MVKLNYKRRSINTNVSEYRLFIYMSMKQNTEDCK